MTSIRLVQLGNFAEEVSRRATSDAKLPVYSVTKHKGFVPSLEYFKKQVFSRDTKGYKVVEPGEIAYATIHLDEGSIGVCPAASLISPMYTVFKVDETQVDVNYLGRLLKSPRALSIYATLGKGSVHRRASISFDRLSKIRVPLPSFAEQRRITTILDKADALRSARRETIAKLDELIQSIFLDMFGDPITNPKKWPFQRLESLVTRKTCNGAYYPAEAYVADGGTHMVHMSDAFYGVVKKSSLKQVACSEKDIEKYGLSTGDILVSRRSLNYDGAAKPCLIEDIGKPLIFESSLIRVTPDQNKIIPLYLYHYLSNERARSKYLFKHVTRSTISGINQSGLNSVEVMVPSVAAQMDFAFICSQISLSLTKLLEHQEKLDAMFSSIEDGAFTGML